ncbi:MAG: hypothetical protein NXI10_07490 [bacterium]|nr:hypothetical protein [bacterium]
MSAAKKKALIVFIVSSVIVAIALCVLPVEFFNGEVTWTVNETTITKDQNLSLSYFFGLGLEDSSLQYADSFRLTGQGWMLAFIFIFGIPGLIAYRMYITSNTSKEE